MFRNILVVLLSFFILEFFDCLAQPDDGTFVMMSNEDFFNKTEIFAHGLVEQPDCSLVSMIFTVRIREVLGKLELVGLTGDVVQLGSWKPYHTIPMLPLQIPEDSVNSDDKDKEPISHWTVTVRMCKGSLVSYRYFIYIVDPHGRKQIRRWENYLLPRTIRVCKDNCNRIDELGIMPNGEMHLNRGWLIHESIVQFKINRRNYLEFFTENDFGFSLNGVLIRVVPLDLKTGVPKRANSANVEVVKMVFLESTLRSQGPYGILCRPDDVVIFHITVAFYLYTAYAVVLHTEDGEPIGHGRIFPDDLYHSSGHLYLTIVSPYQQIKVARLIFSFLVIKPLPNVMEYDFRTSFANTWNDVWRKMEAGLRGLPNLSANESSIVGNTIAAYLTSSNASSDGVQISVHLTADKKVVVFDNFGFYTAPKGIEPKSEKDLIWILVCDHTLEELHDFRVFVLVDNKIIGYPSYNEESDPNKRLFVELESVFEALPLSLGVEVKLKSSQLLVTEIEESKRCCDKNVFVDIVIYITQHYACGRAMFLTSYDPDITTMLRFKQMMIVVCFWTWGTTKNRPQYLDKLTQTVQMALNYVQAFEILLIGMNAEDVFADSSLVRKANDLGKEVFIFGDAIKTRSQVMDLFNLNVTAVFYDNQLQSQLESFQLSNVLLTQCLEPGIKPKLLN